MTHGEHGEQGTQGGRRMLVVGAHSADFVWRAAGAAAVNARNGGASRVVALSYGERGESGKLWQQEGQTEDNVKKVRHVEASAAADAVGADFACFDLGDYPLTVDEEALQRLIELLREFGPDVIVTHTETDPFNPDHPAAHAAVVRARQLSAGSGVASAFRTIKPAELFVFEPHQTELCDFVPTTFVDITTVMDRKSEAMQAMAAQQYLQTYYAQRAEQRAHHARRNSGRDEVQYAEAFQRLLPQVVNTL